MKYRLVILSILINFQTLLFCQNNLTVQGVIKDRETQEPLPFASLSLKNFTIGTVSSNRGDFVFQIPDYAKRDTLVVSYIGYEKFMIQLKSINSPIKVELQPKTVLLNEVIVRPLSPEEYLKKAINKINENYAFMAFQAISYYKEEFKENENLIGRKEAIFESYYPVSGEVQHQLVLFRKPESLKKFSFMRASEEKSKEREKRRAQKRGEKIKEKESEDYNGMSYGGPQSILKLDLVRQRPPFLDTSKFINYIYTFDKTKISNEKELLAINFKSKGKIKQEDNMDIKEDGLILIDLKTYAIVSIDLNGKYIIPIGYRSILLMLGLEIKDPGYKQKVQYEQFNGRWFPKYFSYISSTKMTKAHLLKSNEHSHMVTEQILLVNKIKTNNILPIPKGKIFNPWSKLEDQVYNDKNMKWSEMNILKN